MTNIQSILAKANAAVETSMNHLDTLTRLNRDFKDVNTCITTKQGEQGEINTTITAITEALEAEKKSGLSGKHLYSIIGELRTAHLAIDSELQILYRRKSELTRDIVQFKRDGIVPVVVEAKPFNSMRLVNSVAKAS